MALATFLMTGRLGTISGTITFPALMAYGCVPPFVTIAAVLGGKKLKFIKATSRFLRLNKIGNSQT